MRTAKTEFGGRRYRDSLKEKPALRAVIDAATAAIKAGTLKRPHHGISNAIELNNKGLLELYIFIVMSNESIADDYNAYRTANRDKIRKYFKEYFFVF
jgi:hypothetical protein